MPTIGESVVEQEVPVEVPRKKRKYTRRKKAPVIVVFDGKKFYGQSVSVDHGLLVLVGEGRRTYFNLSLAHRPVEVISETNGSTQMPVGAPALSGGAPDLLKRSYDRRNSSLENMMQLPPMEDQ